MYNIKHHKPASKFPNVFDTIHPIITAGHPMATIILPNGPNTAAGENANKINMGITITPDIITIGATA